MFVRYGSERGQVNWMLRKANQGCRVSVSIHTENYFDVDDVDEEYTRVGNADRWREMRMCAQYGRR